MTKTEEALITETYRSALSVVSDKELIAHARANLEKIGGPAQIGDIPKGTLDLMSRFIMPELIKRLGDKS